MNRNTTTISIIYIYVCLYVSTPLDLFLIYLTRINSAIHTVEAKADTDPRTRGLSADNLVSRLFLEVVLGKIESTFADCLEDIEPSFIVEGEFTLGVQAELL